ncbi:hypothetical protein F5J12DRAFT_410425 [Pisolithus orientalis]|uniref:uncharacterized protein n=1 Tax=Pisolithus orientalis TaxID=936130 RepID=UPI002225B235|nr:uncharacterized protein F5J12DRAFT_410425 [Pisolithus orientalis]KAI5994940.1 hypothetical protein F5J12DRAFT_410425 [Pisolithus orientalis]
MRCQQYIFYSGIRREYRHAHSVLGLVQSPAMLTKQSRVTALRVVATRTQVLHIDTSSIIGRQRKSAAIEGYEEWGEQCAMREILRLRAMVTRARATVASTRATTTTTTTLLSADQQLYKIGSAMLWKWGARSTGTELDSSEVHFDFETLYLHLRYSSENGYIRRRPYDIHTIAILGTTTTITLSADQRPCKSGSAV